MATKTVKHTTKRLGDGEYEYRGCEIDRNDGVSPTYWGRWNARFGGKRWGFSSMADAKAAVDNYLDKKAK